MKNNEENKSTTKLSLSKYKNGGKLIPKFQSGNSSSILSNDPNLLDVIRGNSNGGAGYTNSPSYGVTQDPRDPDGDGYINEPYRGAGQPVSDVDYVNAPSHGGGDYVNAPQPVSEPDNVPADETVKDMRQGVEGITPFKSIPNFKFTPGPTQGTFGNQVDRSFGQNSNVPVVNKGFTPEQIEAPQTITAPEESKKVQSRLASNGPILSRTGINTPIGDFQYDDIVQYLLARKAYKNKLASVPTYQESFQGKGSRNVRGISGIDSSIRNQAMNNIAEIGGSGYQGSDPIMNMITNARIGDAKKKAKMEWVGKEAEHIRNEEARYAAESEQKRQQIAADLVESNRVKNANELRVTDAKHKEAQAEVARTANYHKNLGTLSSNIQGRWNANDKQRKTARAAMFKQDRDREYNANLSKAENARQAIRSNQFYHADNRKAYGESLGSLSESEYETKMKQWDDARAKENEAYSKEYTKYSNAASGMTESGTEDILAAHDKTSKGESLWQAPFKVEKK